jgi:hypothetical protein
MRHCPRKLIIRDAKVQEEQNQTDVFVSSPVELENNSACIQKIHNNSGVAAPIMLLSIEEQLECTATCEEGQPYYNGALCQLMPDQFAHLYVFTGTGITPAEHCIIAFVEATKIGRYPDLLNILCHTVKWLNIENERPHFYIYYFGKQPVFGDSLDDAKIHLTRSLRMQFKNYQEGEVFCQTSNIRTDTANVTVNHSRPYLFKVT